MDFRCDVFCIWRKGSSIMRKILFISLSSGLIIYDHGRDCGEFLCRAYARFLKCHSSHFVRELVKKRLLHLSSHAGSTYLVQGRLVQFQMNGSRYAFMYLFPRHRLMLAIGDRCAIYTATVRMSWIINGQDSLPLSQISWSLVIFNIINDWTIALLTFAVKYLNSNIFGLVFASVVFSVKSGPYVFEQRARWRSPVRHLSNLSWPCQGTIRKAVIEM